MIMHDKNIKSTIRYGLIIIIPLIIATVLMMGYNIYISILKKLNSIDDSQSHNIQAARNYEYGKNIKRVSYLKYVHQNKGEESIYLIEIVRIGKCKYIILSKKNQDPTMLHAYDCDNPSHTK